MNKANTAEINARFHIERISLILLLGCNLKCKNCCVQAPYYKHKYYPRLDFIKREIDALFTVADSINYFSVEGGEIFLRPDLAQILAHIANYKLRIGVEVPVITNGTILPSKDVIDAAKLLGDKIRFIVDDYGKLSPNAHKMWEIFRAEGVRCDVRNYDNDAYCGGWIDLYGDYFEKHSVAEADCLFSKCAYAQKLKGVLEIIGGLIYFCPVSRVFSERGLAKNESVDFLSDNIDVEAVRSKILDWFGSKSLSACRFCNGFLDDSERCKPAEQLTEKEAETVYFSPFKYRENFEDTVL
jgi:hypothetical protein